MGMMVQGQAENVGNDFEASPLGVSGLFLTRVANVQHDKALEYRKTKMKRRAEHPETIRNEKLWGLRRLKGSLWPNALCADSIGARNRARRGGPAGRAEAN